MKKSKLNVLFIVYTLKKDGVSKSLETILNNIDLSKYNIYLRILAYSDFDIKINFKPEILYPSEIEFWNSIISNKYYSYIEEKYDIVVSYSDLLSTKYIIDSNTKGKKIAFIHGKFESIHKGYTNEYLKQLYDSIDNIICVSKSVQSSLLLNLGREYGNKSRVIYNPIDVEKIKQSSLENDGCEIFSQSDKDVNIICISRLSPEKRIDKIIKIHKKLLDENIKNKLTIIGEGELKEYLINLINKLGVNKTCKLKGYIENPYPYIRNSDISILVSQEEGLPLVIMESMVLQKPIIGTQVSGIIDLLENKYGMILKEDEESLYEGLKQMILNENIRSEYINILSKVDKFEFDKNEIIKKIETLFDQICN